jgi:hypothetical protein
MIERCIESAGERVMVAEKMKKSKLHGTGLHQGLTLHLRQWVDC